MEPYTRNGGIIGKVMDFGATDFYGSGSGLTITHLESQALFEPDSTTFTGTFNVSGTSPSDVIVVCAGGESQTNSTVMQINNIIVNGYSATEIVKTSVSLDQGVACGIFAIVASNANINSGTTNITISVTYNSTFRRTGLSVYRLSGTNGTIPPFVSDNIGVDHPSTASVSTSASTGNPTVAVVYNNDYNLSTPDSTDLTIDYQTTTVEGTNGSYGVASKISSTSETLTTTSALDQFSSCAAQATFQVAGAAGNKKNSGIWDLEAVLDSKTGDGGGLYSFTTFTFTNGTAEGRVGPSLSNLLSAYDTTTHPWLTDTQYFNVVDAGIQEWTVPTTGTYRITAVGAAGASDFSSSGQGGRGAEIVGDFLLTAGDIVKIAVGQEGRGGSDSGGRRDPGGGGGTFVWIDNPPSNPLIIAGGGGGARESFNITSDSHGQSGVDAGNAQGPNNRHTLPGQTVGAGHGSWTNGSFYSCSGGGAGWLSEGNDSGRSGMNGPSAYFKQGSNECGGWGQYGRDLRLQSNSDYHNSGVLIDYDYNYVGTDEKLFGGYGSCSTGNNLAHTGGFGGGGGGGCSGEGGGGGYTGGGATYAEGQHGGGGGSYNGGSNQSNTSGSNQGHGYCTITLL